MNKELMKLFRKNYLQNKSKFKKYIEEEKEAGFSLLEITVAIGILLVLSVGGIIAYNGLIKNSKEALYNNHAQDLYTASVVNNVSPEESKINIKEALRKVLDSKDYKTGATILASGKISCGGSSLGNVSRLSVYSDQLYKTKILQYSVITDTKGLTKVVIMDAKIKEDSGIPKEFYKANPGFNESCKVNW